MGWTCERKPPLRAGMLDRADPLARQLVLAAPLVEPAPAEAWEAFDFAGRVTASRGNRTGEVGAIGRGAAHPGWSNTAIEWACRSAFDSEDLTAAVLVEYGADRAAEAVLIGRGEAEPWEVREVFDGERWRMRARVRLAGGGTAEAAVEVGEVAPGSLALAVVRVRSAERVVRFDVFGGAAGRADAETIWPAGEVPAPSSSPVAVGDLPGEAQSGTTGWQGLVHAAWVWGRALTDGEVEALAREPFRMFRPWHARQLVMLAAGAVPTARRPMIWGSCERYAVPARMRPAGWAGIYATV